MVLCIVWVLYYICVLNLNVNIVVVFFDYLILKEGEFLVVIEKGLDFVLKFDKFFILGIKFNCLEIGYGYI